MSLKSKLEAVIYAAEDPVSLAQLAVLFADDALAWQAEQSASVTSQTAEPLPLVVQQGPAELDPGPLMPEPDESEPVDDAKPENEPEPGPLMQTLDEPAPEGEAEPSPQPQPGEPKGDPEPNPWPPPQPAGEEEADDAGADAAAEERRRARQRDREVRAILRGQLDELIAEYASDERGIEIREIAGGYRMATKPECHDAVRAFVKSLKPALKLSLPALETLAVIAYKQPVTAPEINEIRGVETSGVLGSLLARKLIATAGRKPVVGRPILYKTTREFLLRFGLKDVNELPSMEEFEKMAASELDEPELAPQTGPRESAEPALEFDEAASEDSSESVPLHENADPAAIAPAQPPSAAQAETEDPHGHEA